MAHANTLDDELAEVGPASKSNSRPGRRRITLGFNAALLGYQAVTGFLAFAASDRARGFAPEGILLSSGLDLARFVVVMLFTAWFLREFWRRLVADLAPVRPIDFQEALAIALMAGLLLGR